MIGQLPTSLNVRGVDYEIRTDFRDILLILQACMDENLTEFEKIQVLMDILYIDAEKIPPEAFSEAYDKAVWFINCGGKVGESHSKKPLYDFEHDEQILFSAINKVAGKETRQEEYIHFWTFMGYFNEIEDGVFSSVLSIRNKKNNGKPLEKWEREYYEKNKALIDIPKRLTREEREEEKLLQELFF